MTTREFFNAIIALENLDSELRDTACDLLAKMDSKQAHARTRDSEKRSAENAPIVTAISEYLKSVAEPKLTSEVATAVGISTSKASALLRKMAESGTVIASDVKIPKSGIRKAYKWM